jgi:NAD(P)-dependent dehydrogenase (short-subunit alcohol dehydrogenase family)
VSTSAVADGRVCVVTEGGDGVGRSFAEQLAAHGAIVVVNDARPDLARDVVAGIESVGGAASASSEDPATWDGAEQLIDQAVVRHGRLDALVNTCGSPRDRVTFSMSEESWEGLIRSHLTATFAPTRFAAEQWRTQADNDGNDARLINITASGGLWPRALGVNEGSARLGIAALTQLAAIDLARYGVTANAVAVEPLTGFTANLGAAPDIVEKFDPGWPSAVVVWLASTMSEGVTGQVIEASGVSFGLVEPRRRGATAAAPTADPNDVDVVVRKLLDG